MLQTTLSMVKTPSGGNHTDWIDAGQGAHLEVSNRGQRTSTTIVASLTCREGMSQTGRSDARLRERWSWCPSSRLTEVVMMEATDHGQLNHCAAIGCFDRSWHRTIVIEGSVRTDIMVILEVGFEYLPQLPFIEDQHSVRAFTPNRTHLPLDAGVLPRRSRGDQLLLDAHALNPQHEDRSGDRITVPQQILGRCVRRGTDR